MSTQPFGVTIRDRTIRVHGEVDMAVTKELVDAITDVAQADEHDTVVVDVARLTFLDSSGIAALIRARNVVEAMGKELEIYRVPERIHRTLTVAGVVDHLNIRSTL